MNIAALMRHKVSALISLVKVFVSFNLWFQLSKDCNTTDKQLTLSQHKGYSYS